ncbi:MAG TPA: TlpA family protein disulfide reductase [Candidatus Ruminococcus avistercoris]|nr:TlpA family protein disulfide reductase [Candidatus Ruminococcus avistercoris]
MKGKNQKRVTVLILAALLLTGCAQKETGQETGQDAGEEKSGVLSSFTATDLEDNEVSQEILADYDLTLVNVWATFCGPCLREMPSLGELAAEYQPQGVNIIGIVSDTLTSEGELDEDQVDLARDLVEETKAEYTHLLPSQDLFGLLGQIYAVPTTFFVDSEGNQVGDTYMQSMSKEELSELIESHLAQVQG